MDYYQQNQPRIPSTTQQEGFTAAVGIPLVQSIVTGTLCAMTATALCWALEWPEAGKIGIVGGLLVTTGMWGMSLRGWMRRIERVLGVDLNGDGYIGTPPQAYTEPPAPIRVEVQSEQGRHTDILDLPAEPEKLKQLGAALAAGETFTVARWTGPAGLFSRSQYEQLRQEFINRGILRQAGQAANQGYCLSSKGRAVMRGFASMTTQPPTLVRK